MTSGPSCLKPLKEAAKILSLSKKSKQDFFDRLRQRVCSAFQDGARGFLRRAINSFTSDRMAGSVTRSISQRLPDKTEASR